MMKKPSRAPAPAKPKTPRRLPTPAEPAVRISLTEYMVETESLEERTARLRRLRLARETAERASMSSEDNFAD